MARAPCVPTLWLLLAAGCTPGTLVAPGGRSEGGAPPAVRFSPCLDCAAAEPAAAGDPKSDKPRKPPPPQTLFEAIHAYLRCLHAPPRTDPDAEKKSDDGKDNGRSAGADKAETKSPPAASNGKEKDSKSDSGAAPPNNGGPEKDAKENGKGKEANGKDGNGNGDYGKEKKEKKEEEAGGWFSAHAQATLVTQAHPPFHSPYVGPHSLLPEEPSATSMTGTLFLAARLWHGGELVFDPEVAGGRGLSGTLGVAGFPNGEITRVGVPEPTPYFARLYFRQWCGFGGEEEKVEDAPNQIPGARDVDRLTLTVGKLAATDVADDNRYSHDPRTQFLNWSLMYNGAWDYPANVRGYTYGAALELNRKDWALRYGVFAEPTVANGTALDPHIDNANGHVLELEERFRVEDHPGKLRLLAYLNHAHMGNYREALALMPVDPDITLTRAYRIKYGFGLSFEQELTKELGLFARLGWNDGQSESWAFTEIDRTALVGLLLAGRCWCRPDDQLGAAIVVNGISDAHRDYLAAGGLGFILGDGRLNYGPEEILELFYSLALRKGIYVTVDFQGVNHPAYNRDRGPVGVTALRVHAEF
jgi:high affinity Mn2+ porin